MLYAETNINDVGPVQSFEFKETNVAVHKIFTSSDLILTEVQEAAAIRAHYIGSCSAVAIGGYNNDQEATLYMAHNLTGHHPGTTRRIEHVLSYMADNDIQPVLAAALGPDGSVASGYLEALYVGKLIPAIRPLVEAMGVNLNTQTYHDTAFDTSWNFEIAYDPQNTSQPFEVRSFTTQD